jgi:hypothetical protein
MSEARVLALDFLALQPATPCGVHDREQIAAVAPPSDLRGGSAAGRRQLGDESLNLRYCCTLQTFKALTQNCLLTHYGSLASGHTSTGIVGSKSRPLAIFV